MGALEAVKLSPCKQFAFVSIIKSKEGRFIRS